MDYVALIKRAFKITVRYRALWLFGFFLALCGGVGNGGGGGGNGGGGGGEGGRFPFEGPSFNQPDMVTIIAVIAGIVVLVTVLVVVGIIVQVVTRAAIIGMVNQVEETEAVTVKDGWRIGWSARAWRIFLVNLIIDLPSFVVFVVLLLLALSPLLLLVTSQKVFSVLGVVAAIGLFLLWVFLLLAFGVVIAPFKELGWRYAVLNERRPFDSLKESYALIRQKLKDVAITVLVMLGLRIGWGVASFVLVIATLVLGVIVGGIPAGIAYLLSKEVLTTVLVGLPFFLLAFIVPTAFVTGLYLVFQSSMWTLVFRALRARLPGAPELLPPGEPSPEEGEAAAPPDGAAEPA
ncbi:MAG: hypothetical protein ACE5G8_01045 [Anaerolineae bacterium]